MTESIQYAQFIKPAWAPPSWVFGPVWTILYMLIALSFGYVFFLFIKKRLPKEIVLPFALNIIFNILYTPIQFGIGSNIFATVDILLVLGTLVWGMIKVYKKVKWVALINIPYLLWVMFATILQISITILNF